VIQSTDYISNLPDDLMKHVLSYFDIIERLLLLQTSLHFKDFVDALPPVDLESLWVTEDDTKVKPSASLEGSMAIIEQTTVGLLGTSFRAFRPTDLALFTPDVFDDTSRKVSLEILQHLGNEIGNCVSTLRIAELDCSDTSFLATQQALAQFENVTRLAVASSSPLENILCMVQVLQRLTTLRVVGMPTPLAKDQSEGHSIASLAWLPLQELTLRLEAPPPVCDCMKCLMTGISYLLSLKVLHAPELFDFQTIRSLLHSEEQRLVHEMFASMLTNLVNLEEITVFYPNAQLWRDVVAHCGSNGGCPSLRQLTIFPFEEPRATDDIIELADAIIRVFTGLKVLLLVFPEHEDEDQDWPLQRVRYVSIGLETLWEHASLESYDIFGGRMEPTLKRNNWNLCSTWNLRITLSRESRSLF